MQSFGKALAEIRPQLIQISVRLVEKKLWAKVCLSDKKMIWQTRLSTFFSFGALSLWMNIVFYVDVWVSDCKYFNLTIQWIK